MARFLWKWIEWRTKERARAKARTKVVALVEPNGLACCMVVDVDVVVQTKARGKENLRGSQRARRVTTKVGPKVERRVLDVAKWLMDNAPIAWSMGIGAETAHTWQ